jgi:hypothetical protein
VPSQTDLFQLLGQAVTVPNGVDDRPALRTFYESLDDRFTHEARVIRTVQNLNVDLLPDIDVLASMDAIFTVAIAENSKCRNDIGGPIDVAVIDVAGFR